MTLSLNPADHPIIFEIPARRPTSPAIREQIPFVLLLLDLLKPGATVQVGTYYGELYCAICQGIVALALRTRCYGIGQWPDDHAGDLSGKVLANLRAHHDPRYGTFSQLIQDTPAHAPVHLADASVDLLIFGNDPESGSLEEQFALWRPKLTPTAVMLLTKIRGEMDSGQARFWREVKDQFPSFQVGTLGLTAVGQAPPEPLQALLDASEGERANYQAFFVRLGQALAAQELTDGLQVQVARLQESGPERQRQLDQLRRDLLNARAERDWAREQIRQMEATKFWALGKMYWRMHSRFNSALGHPQSTEQSANGPQQQANGHRSSGAIQETAGQIREAKGLAIFALREQAAVETHTVWNQFEKLVADCQAQLEEGPAILDWHSGLNLAEKYPSLAVFSPPAGRTLLYFDRTIDVVVISSRDPDLLPEARRVARLMTVIVERGHNSGLSIHAEWQPGAAAPVFPSSAIIFPCHADTGRLRFLFKALVENLPEEFDGRLALIDPFATDERTSLLKGWADADPRIQISSEGDKAGVVEAFNRAAQVVPAELLVFLEPDVLPLTGCIEALFRTCHHPDAGVVGGKIFYPSGILQQAGGAVLDDGAVSNIGDGTPDADAPRYNYVRTVDFCSGLIAVRRVDWLAVEGLDAGYETAQYALTDLACKLRGKGRRVLYQPEAQAVRFTQARTDNVERDRIKFAAKWQGAQINSPTT